MGELKAGIFEPRGWYESSATLSPTFWRSLRLAPWPQSHTTAAFGRSTAVFLTLPTRVLTGQQIIPGQQQLGLRELGRLFAES